jgi:hypothetical protein
MVSSSISPFETEENCLAFVEDITFAPSRKAADSKDNLVLVDSSAKNVAIILLSR